MFQIANSIVFTVTGEGGRWGNGHFCGDVIFEWPLILSSDYTLLRDDSLMFWTEGFIIGLFGECPSWSAFIGKKLQAPYEFFVVFGNYGGKRFLVLMLSIL